MDVKGEARANMHRMTLEKKRQLIELVRHSQGKMGDGAAATYGLSSGGALLPRLVPQLTGDSGILKRFSAFPTWGPVSAPPPLVSKEAGRSSGEFDKGNRRLSVASEKAEDLPSSVQPQTTGSLFSGWWAVLGGETTTGSEDATSARSYVDGIRKARNADSKLVKHLISLRVHLSTAKISWIESFIAEEGIIAIGGLLSSLVGKGGKRKVLTDTEGSVLLEVIKSLRVLLNTQVRSGASMPPPIT